MIFKIIIHIIFLKDIFHVIPSYIIFFSYCILCLAQKKQKGQLFVMTAFLSAKENYNILLYILGKTHSTLVFLYYFFVLTLSCSDVAIYTDRKT